MSYPDDFEKFFNQVTEYATAEEYEKHLAYICWLQGKAEGMKVKLDNPSEEGLEDKDE